MRDIGRFARRLKFMLFFTFFASCLFLIRSINTIRSEDIITPLVGPRRENYLDVRESLQEEPWMKNVLRKNITSKKALPLSSLKKRRDALFQKTDKLYYKAHTLTSEAAVGTVSHAPVSENTKDSNSIKTDCSKTKNKKDYTNTSILGSSTTVRMIRHSSSTLDLSFEEINHFVPVSLNKIDWHDYKQIQYEKTRTGIGEQGKSAIQGTTHETTAAFCALGYNEALSDKISLNRSLPDLRHPACAKKLYLGSLPSVSVVIPFYKERLSTLLRTVHSVLNRSPPRLLKEVILVDDNEEFPEDYEALQEHVSKLPKVVIIRPPTRSGLMGARNIGARHATGDVLVVLDSHVEANVNWLPPLLEPIAFNHRTVTLPNIGYIEPSTFEYRTQDPGRGIFNWELDFWHQPLQPKDLEKLPEPYENPTMTGGLFAMSRAFFWELGGYDPGLREWAGEQYELSFKIWLCGGRMIEVPCSHVGHLYRVRAYSAHNATRNLRRVVDVWMDEYAQYVYKRMPSLSNVDAGDLTDQKVLRLRLQCKPFHWFLTQVAYDLTAQFPTIDPEPFAEGRIRSKAAPDFCLDAHDAEPGTLLTMEKCDNSSYDEVYQEFVFTWRKELRVKSKKLCGDVSNLDHLAILSCHLMGGNQIWRYHPDKKKITFGIYDSLCLDWHTGNRSLFFTYDCADESETQEWTVDRVNYDRMSQWEQTSPSGTAPASEVL